MILNTHARWIALALTAGLLTACGNYEPVAKSECPKLVKHTNKVLNKLAKPSAELMAECRAMTDEQRGCVKQAEILHDLAQCKKLN